MIRRILMLAAVLSGMAPSGCQTVLLESRKDGSIGKASFGRVLVVAPLTYAETRSALLPEKSRRAAEDELVGLLVGLNTSPSYASFSPQEGFLSGSLPFVKRKARELGFDTLIEMTSAQASSVSETPGLGGGPFGIPGHQTLDVDFRVRIVSLREDHEIFNCVIRRQGVSASDPGVPAVARAAVKQMRAEGLVD